jgi:hypothetical protein
MQVYILIEEDRGMGPTVLNVYASEEEASEASRHNCTVSGPHDIIGTDAARLARIKIEAAAIADALGDRGLIDFADDVRMLSKL